MWWTCWIWHSASILSTSQESCCTTEAGKLKTTSPMLTGNSGWRCELDYNKDAPPHPLRLGRYKFAWAGGGREGNTFCFSTCSWQMKTKMAPLQCPVTNFKSTCSGDNQQQFPAAWITTPVVYSSTWQFRWCSPDCSHFCL